MCGAFSNLKANFVFPTFVWIWHVEVNFKTAKMLLNFEVQGKQYHWQRKERLHFYDVKYLEEKFFKMVIILHILLI